MASTCSLGRACRLMSTRAGHSAQLFLAPAFLAAARTHHRLASTSRSPQLRDSPRPCDLSSLGAPKGSLRGFASTSSNPVIVNDTIFALATGAGRAGVAIIRISGPCSSTIYYSLCLTSRRTPYTKLPPAHKLVLRNLHHPTTGELLDAGVGVIHFPLGQSYTGEESLELHVHGGIATVSDVLDALGSLSDHKKSLRVRPAEAGEFTRRAFENGRLDLASAEALHSLVQAETSVQRKVALQGTAGLQTQRYERLREELLGAMAKVEALIDFGDEDGVEDGTWAAATASVDKLQELLRSELGIAHDESLQGEAEEKDKMHTRHVDEILNSGIRLAIYGPPNAGKSSLLNRLADRDAAIVSDIPGTTRDVLEVHLDLAGYKVIVYDTAGIRDSTGRDEIEAIGIERAREVVRAADLSLLVLSANAPSIASKILRPDSYTSSDPDLVFYNKLDLLSPSSSPPLPQPNDRTRAWYGSVKTNTGISTLISSLATLISQKYALSTTEPPLITQARHRFHLHQCLHHLTHFQHLANAPHGPDLVLAAEELRYAAQAVGKLTGRTLNPDEILGSIFASFCIGK